MSRRLRLLPATLLLLACGRQAPELRSLPRYEDLVLGAAEGGLSSSRALVVEQIACADQFRYALVLAPGQELTVPVELGESPVLHLGGCLGQRHGKRGPAWLEVQLAREDVARLERRIDLPLPTSWWDLELDLAPPPPRAARRLPEPATLSLRAEIPAGRRLILSDLFVEHALPAAKREKKGQPPHQILLISVDTLREDGIGALGGSWPTPALDRFASRAQRFTPHYAAATWTKPSHASIFTGQLPEVHGSGKLERPLPSSLPVLAEELAAAGLRTTGLVHDCEWLDPKFGFDRGFDEYRSVAWHLAPMVRRTLNWMREHRDEPFFYFLHTFEVHSDFHSVPYEGPRSGPRTIEALFSVADYGCREGACASLLLQRLGAGEIEPLPGEDEILRFLYGEGVALVDRHLGVLFAGLERLGLFDSMLIVLTSDHGELLLEHGATLHGGLWEEEVRVPLLIKWPGGRGAGGVETTPSSALDILPTLLARVGRGIEHLPGVDLDTSPPPRPVFAGVQERLVRAGDWKLVAGSAGTALYDVASDPAESRDLSEAQAQRRDELLALLHGRLEEDRARRATDGNADDSVVLTAEERQRLRALGYL